MNIILRWVKIAVTIFCLLSPMLLCACSGSDTREKVDDAVEEMSGKRDVERMQHMKEDIDQIKKENKDRYDRMDDAGE